MAQSNLHIELPVGKKVFFASDFHLGVPNYEASKEREHKIIRWLDSIQHEAAAIFLVGDIFDFWFEYRHVIPKGFLHFQAKLVELTNKGIQIVFFTGNHDMWMFDYFTQELGIPIYHQPQKLLINQYHIYIGHGDGLGKGDKTYKKLKKIFESKFLQWVFSCIHPDWGISLANWWSRKSRASNAHADEVFLGENEWLWGYCKEIEQNEHFDCYIFGHRHLPLDLEVAQNSRYINLGEWFKSFTYAVCDGQSTQLLKFE